MPVVTCQIARVSERPVNGCQKFDVWPVRASGATWTPVYETFDPWKASLCQRASDLHKAVTLALRETRWGLEIVSAEIHETGSV